MAKAKKLAESPIRGHPQPITFDELTPEFTNKRPEKMNTKQRSIRNYIEARLLKVIELKAEIGAKRAECPCPTKYVVPLRGVNTLHQCTLCGKQRNKAFGS